jgi:purine-binding chemotaxis protein CheW
MTQLTEAPTTPTTVAATLTDHGGDRGDAIAAGSDRYLTFVLGGEVFALPILDVTEIMEFRSLTVVPMMPTFIRGVINLRGRVVPVVDLNARFDRGTTQIARRTGIIIVETSGRTDHGGGDGDGVGSVGVGSGGGGGGGGGGGDGDGGNMGIMVDAVNKVVHLSADDIEPPPAFGAGIRADFIAGMARYDGEFIIVLDVSRVLSLDELAQLSRAAVTAQPVRHDPLGPEPAEAGERPQR